MINQHKVIIGDTGRFSIVILILFVGLLWASGGYDHGTSTGKGKLQLDLTWNPFNYFKQGQSYAIFGYGLTNRLDIHGYYSYIHRGKDNYYGGFSYQFYKSKRLDLSTAIGIRKYVNETKTHLFLPQLLYTIYLSERLSVGGSFVDIRDQNLDTRKGLAKDVFLMLNEFKKTEFVFTAISK